jgi:glycosyltransferase involved in cell wall biosynthesis
MIYFDTTKASRADHASGLNRVSARLRDELGADASPVVWHDRRREWRNVATGAAVAWRTDDWLLTGELFGPDERPGLVEFLAARHCRTAAIFYDAIPLKLPHITWPQSVARHPGYLTMLAEFDRVLAISRASADELREFWQWQGRAPRASVTALTLGADFNRRPRTPRADHGRSGFIPDTSRLKPDLHGPASLLCVGILEPRKNQLFLLEVCETLWREGLRFDLHLVGRVNPHFGKPVAARAKALRQQGLPVSHHEGVDDATLLRLYATAHATAFPTIAEGCGLPVLESLWMGLPCVCSDLPVLRENSDGGGCVSVALNDHAAWAAALRRVLTDHSAWRALTVEAASRPLPIWTETARQVRAALGG